MKIAILSPFHPFRGGIAQFNARLYTELAKKNEVKAFSFTTLYPGFLFPGKSQFVSEQDPAIAIENERLLNSINPFSYIRTAKQINKYQPDILFIPYWISFLAPAFGSIVRLIKKDIKVIVLVHNAIPHEKRFFDSAFAKFFFRKCDSFITLSELVKRDLLQLIPDANILINPHPVYDHYKERINKSEACRELNIKPDKKNLLFFGLIREYKGLDILIKAMSFLDESYQLIIAGESYDDFNKYQSLIDQSPLKENITVKNQYIPDDMVTLLFSASDALILPYRSATQSGVLLLAYQMETPVITTNVGTLGDTISTAKTGIVVNEADPESIANGIKSYFISESAQSDYLNHIKEEKKRLSWKSFTDSLQTFFEQRISKS